MRRNRILTYCVALSALLHVVALALATRLEWPGPRPADVMEVDLADIPRPPDFLPPQPGIVRSARPVPPPKPVPPPAEARRTPAGEILRGRVPDLPIDPEKAPEKEFPAEAPKAESPARREPAPAKAAAPAARPGGEPREPGAAPGSPKKTVLVPSLGRMVEMARTEAGGLRGDGSSRGNAAGTEGKAKGEKGAIAEEAGGSLQASLETTDARYISYLAGIKRKIELTWNYPADAMYAGVQGDLTIVFVIGSAGALESVRLVRGSGHRILDDEAQRAIRAANPYNPFPKSYTVSSITITAHFVYGLTPARFR